MADIAAGPQLGHWRQAGKRQLVDFHAKTWSRGHREKPINRLRESATANFTEPVMHTGFHDQFHDQEIWKAGVEMGSRHGVDRAIGIMRLNPRIVRFGERRDLAQLRDAARMGRIGLDDID